MIINASKAYSATVKTDVGTFVIALDAKDAPQTVNNFVFLAQHHFFDCVIFHRVIPGLVGPNGGPDWDGERRPGVHHPRRVAGEGIESCRPVPARIRSHGQHRPTS